MIKRVCILVMMSVLWMQVFLPQVGMAQGTDLAPQARSAVLMDSSTGKVIYEKNPHEKLSPASITKVMTMLLIMEALESGKIHLKDSVRVSEKAASMGGSQIYLEPGEQMSVHELLKGIAIGSANDASVALAEHIAGSEQQFIEMMNQRARQLGLKNTQFRNVNGLPVSNHYSTAYDIAVMSRELLRYPAVTNYTGIYEDYLRKGSKKPFWLVNTNRLIRFYKGLDGLKTGFTEEAKFYLTATAKQKNFRVIAVVMGEPNAKARNQEVAQMLDYAFHHYQSYPIYKKGERIAKIRIDKGDPGDLEVVTKQPVHLLLKRGESPQSIRKQIRWKQPIQAPIAKGESLGQLQLIKEGRILAQYELISTKKVEKAGFWTSCKQIFYELFH